MSEDETQSGMNATDIFFCQISYWKSLLVFSSSFACQTLESESECQLSDWEGRSRECREYNRQSACPWMLKQSTGCQNLTLLIRVIIWLMIQQNVWENIAKTRWPMSWFFIASNLFPSYCMLVERAKSEWIESKVQTYEFTGGYLQTKNRFQSYLWPQIQTVWSRMPASTNGYLPVDGDEHRVYWEVDNEEGEGKIPVLVLHGGWGPLGHDGRFLDRSRFRRVYMHQRGWGNSTPIGMK